MASVVGICNVALGLCGVNRIISLEDGNKASGLCASMYPVVRDAALRTHPWNFAAKRALLPALTNSPAWGYEYQYQQPDDCVGVNEIEPECEWEIEGRQILTDCPPPLKLRYRVAVEDPNHMDPAFRLMLAYELAKVIGPDLTQSRSRLQEIKDGLKDSRKYARRADAQERSTPDRYEDEWAQERL